MRSPRLSNPFASACALALAALAAFVVPVAVAAIHFEKESLSSYESQLRHHQVHAVAFHPGTPTGHLHISLNNGGHDTVAYAPAQQSALVAQANAAHVRVQVATLKAKAAAAVHHKLRYIAGGILIVVILVVLVVLLIGRRRTLAEEGREGPGESSAS